MAGRIASPILVGRLAELGRLRGALDEAVEGSAVTILVGGEAGVGKSRLVDAFAAALPAGEALILSGACLELGDGGLPYAPLTQAIRELRHEIGQEAFGSLIGPARAELSRLVPEIGDGPGPVVESSATSTARLFELTLGFVERLAATTPLIFVLEDLHWADPATRDFLRFLVRNADRQRLLIVGTYRTDALHRRHPLLPLLAELERTSRVQRLDLQPLTRVEVGDLVVGILGRPADRTMVESIANRSAGNAFYVEELVAGWLGGGGMPNSLRDVVLTRFEELEPVTQDVLRAAAVIGPRFDESVLQSVTGHDVTDLETALRSAVNHQLIEPVPDAPAPAYRFRHALTQEVVEADQLPGERARRHAAAARALTGPDAGGVGPLDVAAAVSIARHWHAAHDQPRSLKAAVAAGRAAARAYAFAEAAAQFDVALLVWDQVPDAEAVAGADRIDVTREAADAAWLAGDGRAAVSRIRSAIDLIDSEVDPVTAGLLQERLGQYLWDAGDDAAARAAYETAAWLLPTDPPSEGLARVRAARGQMLMLAGHYNDSISACQGAIEIANSVGARAVEGHARCTLGVDLAYEGRIEDGISELNVARQIAESLIRPDDLGRALLNIGLVLWHAGQLEASTQASLAGREAVRHLGLDRTLGRSMVTNAAITRLYQGRWSEAAQLIDEALEKGAEDLVGIHLLLTRAQLAVGRGDWPTAEADLVSVDRLAQPVANSQLIGDVHAVKAELAIWRGRLDDARAEVARGLELLGDTEDALLRSRLGSLGIRAEADRAELARARRIEAEAATAADVATRLLDLTRQAVRGDTPSDGSFGSRLPGAYLQLCEAESSRLAGSSDPQRWSAAAEAWDALQVPYPAAYARWREAEARLGRGGSKLEAQELLRGVWALCGTLAAEPLRREVEALARRARLDLSPDEAPGTEAPQARPEVTALGLTSRELEVLALVAAGRTNRRIAESLFITEKTAGAHVSNILGKLGVAGRVEAAGIAHRLGIVDEQTSQGD